MSKEEKILREYIEFADINGSETVNVLPLTIADIMQEYSNLQNKELINKLAEDYKQTESYWSLIEDGLKEVVKLQSKLVEKDNEIEGLKQSVDRHETDYSDLQNRNIFLKEKFDNSLKTVKALSGELTELKEKHKRDVIAAYRSGKSNGIDRENIMRFKGHDAAEIENVLAEDYYNETHKTK